MGARRSLVNFTHRSGACMSPIILGRRRIRGGTRALFLLGGTTPFFAPAFSGTSAAARPVPEQLQQQSLAVFLSFCSQTVVTMVLSDLKPPCMWPGSSHARGWAAACRLAYAAVDSQFLQGPEDAFSASYQVLCIFPRSLRCASQIVPVCFLFRGSPRSSTVEVASAPRPGQLGGLTSSRHRRDLGIFLRCKMV